MKDLYKYYWAFINLGYTVDAFDASPEMVNCSKEVYGLNVWEMRFEEYESSELYDGIWCCASLLHVRMDDLQDAISRLMKSLKNDGVMYISFKYGNTERVKDGRHFTDMDEKSLQGIISRFDNLTIESIWLTDDVRPHRDDKWLNAILKKVGCE